VGSGGQEETWFVWNPVGAAWKLPVVKKYLEMLGKWQEKQIMKNQKNNNTNNSTNNTTVK